MSVIFYNFIFQDCQDVCPGGGHLCHLLGSLPHLLHHHLPQPQHRQDQVHWSHLPALLLAGHVPDLRQPHHLLLDEQVQLL